MTSAQGAEYARFVEEELASEESRRETVNSRAFTSIAASGTQFAITTALIIFLQGESRVPGSKIAWVFAAALLFYLISVALGLAAIQNRKTERASIDTMTRMLTDHWEDHEVDARNAVATAHVKAIAALRAGTNAKSKWLKRSVLVQIFAVAILAVGVVLSAMSYGH